MWLVVLSAVVSAMHYFQMFWSQINFRVQQRHRRACDRRAERKTAGCPHSLICEKQLASRNRPARLGCSVERREFAEDLPRMAPRSSGRGS